LLDHLPSRRAFEAEREVVRRLGGGCALPLGAYAEAVGGSVRLLAVVIRPDGSDLVRAEAEGRTPEAAAAEVADALLAGGAAGIEASAPPASVAVVGDGTAGALRDRGVEPALVPGTFTTEALGRAMPTGTGRVLLARADIAPDGLQGALSAKGWTPVRVDAY